MLLIEASCFSVYILMAAGAPGGSSIVDAAAASAPLNLPDLAGGIGLATAIYTPPPATHRVGGSK